MEFDIGKKFGLLIIVGEAQVFCTKGGWQYLRIPCLCDCGKKVIVRKSSLKENKIVSCGCIRRGNNNTVIHKRHGMYGTQIYHSWFAMKQRCNDPLSEAYRNYGGRGITICDKWKSFFGFYEDMGPSFIEDYTIDRIDVNGNYNKENCRWATKKTQAYNQRKSATNKSGKTGVCFDKKANKWKMKFFETNGEITIKWFKYLWDAVFERMLLEQINYGYVKE